MSSAFTSRPASSPRPGTTGFDAHRTIAKAVGLLILVATATYMIGGGLVDSVVALPDFLAEVHPNRMQLVSGVLLQVVCGLSIATVGILMFRVLRKYSEAIALGYALTRVVECTLLIVAGIGSLVLVPLSQQFIQGGGADSASLQALATVLVAHSGLSFHFAMAVLGLGSIPFCYLLYRHALVPRGIALLGLITYPLLVINGALEAFGTSAGIALFLPGAVFELVFPIWLIAKGFNSPAATTAAGKRSHRQEPRAAEALTS